VTAALKNLQLVPQDFQAERALVPLLGT